MQDELTILYIASASRSGSTLLEHSLGALPGVCNFGELRRLRDFYIENEKTIRDPVNRLGCSCGAKVRDCEFWRSVEIESGLDFAALKIGSQLGTFNRALLKSVYFLMGARGVRLSAKVFIPFRRELRAAEDYFRVYRAIGRVAKCSVIVDSSKMVHQFLMLKAVQSDPLKLIVLVRDGRAVSKSMTRGDRYLEFGSASRDRAFGAAVRSWAASTAQMLVFYLRVRRRDRYFLKYERACGDMDSVLRDVRARFGIGEQTNGTVVVGHAIGGSPSRFGATFKKVSLDESWRSHWTSEERRIFMLWGSVVNRILGYPND